MRSISITLILFLITTIVCAQNIPSNNRTYSESTSSDITYKNKIVKLTDSSTNQAIEKKHFDSGQIKSENHFVSNTVRKFHGKQTYWNENGEISSEIYYKNGKKHGSFMTYWESGQLKRQDFYKNGVFTEGFCWNKEGVNIEHTMYKIQPKFPGGSKELAKYLTNNMKYPRNSRNSSSRGKVIVSFSIENDGKIADVRIKKGVNQILNKEAKRVVENMPNWLPAMIDGNAISQVITMPIVFFRN
jgi:protein TonB